MKSIRDEIQEWLELVVRAVKNIPFETDVEWWDIEDVYNGSHCDAETPTFKTSSGVELSFETVYCDAIAIDHMCSEILEGDFDRAMIIIERYKGIKLSDNKNFETNLKKVN